MSYGYSTRLVKANKKASIKNPGVRLGRACIKHDIPVYNVAARMGVSRQTVYNWFSGVNSPRGDTLPRITQYLHKITSA